jgi:hypothetical protein
VIVNINVAEARAADDLPAARAMVTNGSARPAACSASAYSM